MKSGAFVVLCLLLLSACTAAKQSQGLAYSEANSDALIAVLDFRIKTGSIAIMRQVDMEKGQLFGKAITLGDNKTNRTPAYLLRKVPPGTYAITHIVTTSRVPFRINVLCRVYKPAIEVFEVSPGTVSEVKLGHLKPGSAIAAPNLEKVLKSYPDITAPVQQAKLLGLLETQSLASNTCRSLRYDDLKLKTIRIKQGIDA